MCLQCIKKLVKSSPGLLYFVFFCSPLPNTFKSCWMSLVFIFQVLSSECRPTSRKMEGTTPQCNEDDGPMTIDVSLETGQVIDPQQQSQSITMSTGQVASQQGPPQGYSDLQVSI